MDHVAGHHVSRDQLTERLEQPGDVAEPLGQLAAIDIDAAAGIDLGLPVERKMVAELGDGDMREQDRPRLGFFRTCVGVSAATSLTAS